MKAQRNDLRFCRIRRHRGLTHPARLGLSLFEVVIAVSILASGFAVLSSLISVGNEGAVRAALELEALVRAESVLDEVVSGVTEMASVGETAFADDQLWTYEVVVEPDASGLPLNFCLVRVFHVNTTGKQNAKVELSRLIYIPPETSTTTETDSLDTLTGGSGS